MPTALITGITGQDGSYLAEHLLDQGYDVVGVVRHSSADALPRIEHLRDQVALEGADLFDQTSLLNIIDRHQPDEVYNRSPGQAMQPSRPNSASRAVD